MTPFFIPFEGRDLAQGDLLPDCPVPEFSADFSVTEGVYETPFKKGDLIIVTQSCDLENNKAAVVALCPVFHIADFAAMDQKFTKPKELENLRKGRYEGLQMLASPENPGENQAALIVDLRQLFSLPHAFLSNHAARLGKRWRLVSPFLEHFSQTFARAFMRVALPSSVPAFK